MGFSRWARELANYYFGPHAADEQVRLLVSEEMLDSSFAHLSGRDGFVASVSSGPDWVVNLPDDIVARVNWLHDQWTRSPAARLSGYPDMPYNCPPHLPYLVLLSLAWTIEAEGYAGHNFYNRLELIYKGHDLNTRLAHLETAWRDLEMWSVREREGKCGNFYVEQLGQMQHVGIPRAQAIFTPNRLARLPELFYRCGLIAEDARHPDHVRNILLEHQAYLNGFLGGALAGAIADGDDLGDTALQTICMTLIEEPPYVPELELETSAQENGQKLPVATTVRRLRLGLRYEPNVGFQTLFICPPGDAMVASARLKLGEHYARFFSEQGNMVLRYLGGQNDDEIGDLVPAAEYAPQWLNGVSFSAQGAEDFQGQVRLPNRAVRFFTWQTSFLVESDGLPPEGAVYILYSAVHSQVWDIWRDSLRQFIYPNLPALDAVDYNLLCITDVQAVSERCWNELPGTRDDFTPRMKYITVTGGSRQVRGTVRRPYLPYDLPVVSVTAKPDVAIKAYGATLQLINIEAEPNPAASPVPTSVVQQSFTRHYEIIDVSSSVVTLQVLRDQDLLDTKSIHIAKESDVKQVADEQDFFVDAQGHGPASKGMRGAVLNEELTIAAWEYDDSPSATPVDSNGYSQTLLESKAFRLLESFSQHPRLMYREARRRALQITGVEEWLVIRLIRWLCNLGYLDIHYGYQGRWAYIYPSQLTLYLPCYKQGGRFEAVVTGCSTRLQLQYLIEAGIQRGCEVRIVNRDLDLHYGWDALPGRISLLHNDVKVFAALASEFTVKWKSAVPAWQIANWSASHDIWADQLDWRDGAVDHSKVDATYCPQVFTTVSGLLGHEPISYGLYRLRPDEQERSDYYCQLERVTDSGGSEHAFVADRSWGRWKAHWSAMDFYLGLARSTGFANVPEKAPLLYENDSTLVIPSELVLPYNLARAVFLSSGLVPQIIINCDAYRMPQNLFVPNQAYDGSCFAYQNVHPRIASIVAEKLGVSLRAMPLQA